MYGLASDGPGVDVGRLALEDHAIMPVMADLSAVATVRIDNGRVRVTEWRFAPGATTGFHRHEYDYVVVPLSTGRLGSTGPAGDTVTELAAGLPYFRAAGVEHDVRNVNAFEFAFVEIELKAP